MTKIPVLLLAAGSSSRMGQPKQLLPWGNSTLIEYQILKLLKTGNPVSVVLGCNAEMIIPVIEKYSITIITNDHWKAGMGSSISCGINQIIKSFPHADGVLIALSDQPLVTSLYFGKLISAYHPGEKQIIVSQSESGWTGVPALFDKCYYNELSKLSGEEGAKIIINRYRENLIFIDGGEMLQDIDTPESYQVLLKGFLNYN
jgi:molybdenum cofactor cytidylyltransferase